MSIYNDCIVCEDLRTIANTIPVSIGKDNEAINIISCRCSRSLDHDTLYQESFNKKFLEGIEKVNNAGAA